MKLSIFLTIVLSLCLGASLATPAAAQKKRTQTKKTQTKKSRTKQNKPSRESSGNHLVVLTGQCRLQIVEGFFPCDSKVVFSQFAEGRSTVSFVKTEKGKETMLILAGKTDRQPNLENYYLGIDALALVIDGKEIGSDFGMEGECHFKLNKDAAKFFSVKCDVYNRAKGMLYNFYLENITKTDHAEL